MFFSGGGGGGEEELQVTTAETFSQDDASSKQTCLCYILYISQWGFRCRVCLQVIVKGVLDPRLSWADTCAVRLRQPVDLVHVLKTVKGLFSSFHHGLHGAVGMMFIHIRSMLLYVICLLHVYVCYMSSSRALLLHVYVCYTLLYVIYLLYVICLLCLVLGGVVRVRLYVIYAHLCNHILLQKWLWWDLGHSSVHC